MIYAAVIRLGTSMPTKWLDEGILNPTPPPDVPLPPPLPDRDTWGLTPNDQAGMTAAMEMFGGGVT